MANDHVDDEMHELNEEADYLEQKVTVDSNGMNGHKPERRRASGSADPEAQAQVIESLRSQVQDLFSQVSQLNGKLVRSYDRVSDLEDELHVTSANLRTSTLKVSQLELERTQHLSALSTGLLVEKSHVTNELTRLMEKATEEAARAGEAESARVAIEQDLDDLSATLFSQANSMVAEARLARARSERKVEETEVALKGAEEIVGVLQAQMQALQAEKEDANKKVEEMRAVMGKGKWVDRPTAPGQSTKMRLMSLHAPYAEYVQFITHLRTIRPSAAQPPPMSTLLPLPFLARILVEDSDPTVRLDLAPSLNWLSRRSVISAIHGGQLTIEPMSTTTLLEELCAASSIPGNSHNTHISCALCGASIIDPPTSPNRSTSFPLSQVRSVSGSKGSWSPAFLKNSLQSITASPFAQNSRPSTPTVATAMEPPDHVFIFRLEVTASGGISVSIPLTSPQPPNTQRPPTIYPLCSSGWCLARLRSTCSLWAFIRTSVVEKVWEEEPYLASTNANSLSRQSSNSDAASSQTLAPAQSLQPKRSRIGIGSLWGSMSRTLSGTTKELEPMESPKPKEEVSDSGVNKPVPPVPPRRMPPPPPRHPPIAAPIPRPAAAAGPPPPLPKRNRQRTTSQEIVDTTDSSDTKAKEPALLSPPEEEERFTTPVEEIAPPSITRPLSPSTVPLPASAPATPAFTASEHPEAPALSATPPPIRLNDEKPPSRSGSPVPPPLPRRAAGRARPTSLALVSGPPAETEAENTEQPTESKTDTVTSEAPEKVEPLSKQPEQTHAVERIEETAEEPTTEPTPVIVADEPHNSSTSDVSAVHESEKVSLQDVPLATDSERENDNEVQKVDGTPENMSVSDHSAEDDPRSYVGDASWEERAWKELVKLREEMFWARVGGVR